MGPTCFRGESFMVIESYVEDGETRYRRMLPPPRCQVGDRVLFTRQEQLRVPVYGADTARSNEDVVVRFTTDACVIAAAPHPDQLKVYIA